MLFMWMKNGKVDASMSGNGLLAGLVAITAPSGFVSSVGACIIGFIAGVLVVLSCAFIENVMKVDDPVGAISVHGTCGLWGVLSVGFLPTAPATTAELERSHRHRHRSVLR